MSQAEHDVLASAILLTTSQEIADETVKKIKRQLAQLSRREIIEKIAERLRRYHDQGNSMDEAVELANRFAPEHLEVMAENPLGFIGRSDNAGSVFLGEIRAGAAW